MYSLKNNEFSDQVTTPSSLTTPPPKRKHIRQLLNVLEILILLKYEILLY